MFDGSNISKMHEKVNEALKQGGKFDKMDYKRTAGPLALLTTSDKQVKL